MSVKTFFDKVGEFLKKVFGSTTVQQTVKATLSVLTPLVVEIVQLGLGSAASTVAQNILNDIQTDFATLSVVAQGAISSSPSTTLATFNAVVASLKANLSALLTDADIKNSAKFATIEDDVNFFLNEIGAIETAIAPALAAQSPAAPTAPASPVAPIASSSDSQTSAAPATSTENVIPFEVAAAHTGTTPPAAHTDAAAVAKANV